MLQSVLRYETSRVDDYSETSDKKLVKFFVRFRRDSLAYQFVAAYFMNWRRTELWEQSGAETFIILQIKNSASEENKPYISPVSLAVFSTFILSQSLSQESSSGMQKSAR